MTLELHFNESPKPLGPRSCKKKKKENADEDAVPEYDDDGSAERLAQTEQTKHTCSMHPKLPKEHNEEVACVNRAREAMRGRPLSMLIRITLSSRRLAQGGFVPTRMLHIPRASLAVYLYPSRSLFSRSRILYQ